MKEDTMTYNPLMAHPTRGHGMRIRKLADLGGVRLAVDSALAHAHTYAALGYRDSERQWMDRAEQIVKDALNYE